MSNPAPGFQDHPGYQVDIVRTDDHVRIRAGDVVVADTHRPLRVQESRHRPVWYVPLEDVDASRLSATEHSTYCPFKGHASYWTVNAAEVLENAVWGYLTPFDECQPLAGHVAFYTDRVVLEVNGEPGSDLPPGWTD